MLVLDFDKIEDTISEEEQQEHDEESRKLLEELQNNTDFKKVYLPESMINQIKDEFDCTVVHDFGDDFHKTEEEKEKLNQFYSIFKELAVTKSTYRKIDEYVKVMRIALKCLDAVAKDNKIYDEDKFKMMVLKGKIKVYGLRFPRYKGKDKKHLSWEYITEFILSDQDPKELLKKNETEYLSIEEIEDSKDVIFTDDELQRILYTVNEDEGYVKVTSDKKMKKAITETPELLRALKEIKRKDESGFRLQNTYAYDVTYDDFEHIQRYDEAHNYSTNGRVPKFKGDFSNKDDVNRYLYELNQYECNNIKENYNGTMMSLEEIREIELKKLLEESGWNIRKLWDNKDVEKKLKNQIKKDKKKEERLKAQLLKVQGRLKGDDINKKSSKKNKKKNKKKAKKEKEKLAMFREEVRDTADKVISDYVDMSIDEYEDWKDDVLDMTWDNITK